SGRATSRADGTFRIHRGAPRADTGKRGVDLFAQAPGLEQVKTSEGVAWGQHDVEVVMQSLATVVVRALDASGRPVRGFDVLHARLAADGLSLIDYAPPNVVDAGDGSVRLSALRSGAHVLLLRAHDERLAVAGPIPFAVDDASSREVLVHVCDRNQTEVEVVDTAGAPVPACELDLIAAMARAPVDGAMPAPRVEGLRSEGLRGMRQVSLAHGSTDASGVAHLGAPPGSFSLCLRCETHLPLLAPVTIAGTASRLRLVMEPAAVLHGRLVPAVALRAFAPECDEAGHGLAVVMRGIEPGGRAAAVDVATAEVGADGTFRLGALPAGTFRILLRAWLRCSDIHSAAILHALGDIDVAAGARMERDFPVDAYLPAAASGVVLLDAEPVVGQQFFLQRIEPAPRLGVRVATDGNGRFQTRLPPGVYQPQLAIPAQPGPGYVMLPLPQRCAIAAGASEDLRIEACARRLRLRVLGSDGAPLANRRIRTDNKNGYYRPGALATDAHGVVELQPAPYGAFFLFAPDGDRAELTIGPLELPPGDGAAELEFRVGG
ncbi:MAG TPA: hypothetical protein VFZ65_10980, partial [Planctomycetota bacterium]|nr:hypothetical protein [Planctomycetota bacterium]